MTPLGQSTTAPRRVDGMAVWEGGEADDPWKIELESDAFDEDEGLVVSLWVENDGDRDAGLARLSPADARGVAAELLALADHVEKRRAER